MLIIMLMLKTKLNMLGLKVCLQKLRKNKLKEEKGSEAKKWLNIVLKFFGLKDYWRKMGMKRVSGIMGRWMKSVILKQ